MHHRSSFYRQKVQDGFTCPRLPPEGRRSDEHRADEPAQGTQAGSTAGDFRRPAAGSVGSTPASAEDLMVGARPFPDLVPDVAVDPGAAATLRGTVELGPLGPLALTQAGRARSPVNLSGRRRRPLATGRVCFTSGAGEPSPCAG